MYGDPSEPRALPATEFHILEPDRPATVAGVHIFPFRVPHQTRAISLGLKVNFQGKIILFSGDSAWTEQFVAQARGADLFLCECCFYDREVSNHMNYRTLEANLGRLDCKRIVLTHMGEEMLARNDELKVPSAYDGMVIEV